MFLSAAFFSFFSITFAATLRLRAPLADMLAGVPSHVLGLESCELLLGKIARGKLCPGDVAVLAIVE